MITESEQFGSLYPSCAGSAELSAPQGTWLTQTEDTQGAEQENAIFI